MHRLRPDFMSVVSSRGMNLVERLRTLDDDLTLDQCILHLATRHGASDPLDLYRKHEFDEWQSYQRKRSFKRKFVIALIRKQEPDLWLFAGVYDVRRQPEPADHVSSRHAREQCKRWGVPAAWKPKYIYQMCRLRHFRELEGRTVKFTRPQGSNHCRLAEKLSSMPELHEHDP